LPAAAGTPSLITRFLKDNSWEVFMLRWAVIFLVVGLLAGVLGFTGIAGASFAIAKILFFIFMVLFLLLLVGGLTVARRVSGD
jgi:uncharacterized membrane protein YtjA (UPF0391 family)